MELVYWVQEANGCKKYIGCYTGIPHLRSCGIIGRIERDIILYAIALYFTVDLLILLAGSAELK